eukprot:1156561-Pelagomonas_calceolata.AAC.11
MESFCNALAHKCPRIDYLVKGVSWQEWPFGRQTGSWEGIVPSWQRSSWSYLGGTSSFSVITATACSLHGAQDPLWHGNNFLATSGEMGPFSMIAQTGPRIHHNVKPARSKLLLSIAEMHCIDAASAAANCCLKECCCHAMAGGMP